ncbi:MAG TPA: hypothetical protein IAC62_04225 [Candidatus Pelethocola excrementipullorum]|nr:hypothetical protein [Candidatus Pelethocola excrementipullorum]
MEKRQNKEKLVQKTFWLICQWLRTFCPPLRLSLFGTVIFSVLSLVMVSTDYLQSLPEVIHYITYGCAGFFLVLAIWAMVVLLKTHSLKQMFVLRAEENPLSSKLLNDFSFRTMMAVSCSLLLNIILTAFKMVTGWYYASHWLMVLSGYYIILILAKFILLGYGIRKSQLTDEKEKIIHDWKAYRLCGIMLFFLTAFLQGVVILIVKEGQGFSYHEIVVITIAAYDFYCLGSAIYYMITKRRKHSPIVNAIKSISFASSLVAILSLQTAMFSSFAKEDDLILTQVMNIATGTVVCVILIVLGVMMIVKANKKLKSYKESSI